MTTTEPVRAPARTHQLAGRMRSRRSRGTAGAALALALTGVLGLAACSAEPAAAPTVNVSAGPVGTGAADGVTVEGTGEVEGTPDTLTVTFGVSVKRPTVDEAVAANAEVATSVLQALIEQGVAEEDVQTRNYSVQPAFTYADGQAVPDGYQVDNQVTVQLHDLEGSGAAIDAVTAAGGDAVRVQGVAFSLEDDSEVVRAARDEAFADALAKAEQFAALSGRPLGTVEAVAETTRRPEMQYSAAAFDESAGGRASTPISPGEVTTSVTVTVRFALG